MTFKDFQDKLKLPLTFLNMFVFSILLMVSCFMLYTDNIRTAIDLIYLACFALIFQKLDKLSGY